MSFKVHVIVGKKPIPLEKIFTTKDTILSIKEYYRNNENNSVALDRLILRYRGKKMDDKLTIGDYNPKPNRQFVCSIRTRVDGGSNINDDEKKEDNKIYKIGFKIKNRKRILDESSKKILKTTKKKCCMYGDCKDINIIMKCGDIFCPDFIFDYIHDKFSNDCTIVKIYCPVLKCKKEWEFDDYSIAACLYDDEFDAISTEIEIRLSPEMKDCPNCGNPNEKPDNLNMFRVACICKKGDWCWYCGNKWIGGGFTVCGNKDCISNEINIELANCGTKTLDPGYGSIVVPELRACPYCHTLIEHTSACKHMKCQECKERFCFSCLKSPDSKGNWPCKEYNFKCPAAPRQVLK